MIHNGINYPKVLIVSHNAFSMTNNMGKTLVSFFQSFPKECLAQLYFHEGVPHSNICSNYYCFSDKDALSSIINRHRKGTVYKDQLFDESSSSLITGAVYSVGKSKNPIISFARDNVWKLSNWKNSKLINWVKDFSPDIIFFASGDYIFSYKIALQLSKMISVPLATCCFDDYYLFCAYKNKAFGKLYHKCFLKIAKETIHASKTLFTVNELMAQEYFKLFGKKSAILFTPAKIVDEIVPFEKKKQISYIGGLSLGRDLPLCEIGKALKKGISGIPSKIDVYSAENRENILKMLTEENGISFHGAITPDEVQDTIRNSLAVIHVESFDPCIRQRTRLSLSTKIAESLASGTVLLAYGPSEVASMQYLKQGNAAIVSDNIEEFISSIKEVLCDSQKYESIINNAKELCVRNHQVQQIQNTLLRNLI